MTPTELRDFVDALKASGLMSFHVKVPVAHTCTMGSGSDMLEIAGVFGPEPMPAEMGAPVTAGGWKGPERLDANFEDELPPLTPPQPPEA